MYKKIIMLLTCGALNATSTKSRLCCHRRNSGTNLAVSSTAKPIGTSLEGPSLDAFLTTRYPRDANRAELEAELDAAQQAYHEAVSEELRPSVEGYWEKDDDTYRLALKNLAKCREKAEKPGLQMLSRYLDIQNSMHLLDPDNPKTINLKFFLDPYQSYNYFTNSETSSLKSKIDEIKALLNQNLQKIDPDLDCLECIKKFRAASNEFLSDLDELEKQLSILLDRSPESFVRDYNRIKSNLDWGKIIRDEDDNNFNLCKRFLEARNALQNYKELLKLKSLSTGIKQEIDKRKKSEKEKADDQQSVNEGQG